MAALENTLATVEDAADGVVKPAPAVEEVADDALDAAASEADDAVTPLEAWVEQKEAEEKTEPEEKKLHECVFDTARTLGLNLKRAEDGRATVTSLAEDGQAAAGRLKVGYILSTLDGEPCTYDLFLECFQRAKELKALISVGFEKVKKKRGDTEEEIVEAECDVQEAILERAPPDRRDILAKNIKDRLRMLDATVDPSEASEAAFASYVAKEQDAATEQLKTFQEAWRKESNAKDRSTIRRVAELKAENDRLAKMYASAGPVADPTVAGLDKVAEFRQQSERLRMLHG